MVNLPHLSLDKFSSCLIFAVKGRQRERKGGYVAVWLEPERPVGGD